MLKKHAYPRKNSIYIIMLCFITFLLFAGCRKTSWQHEDQLYGNFFYVSDDQPELVKQIALRIRLQDLQEPFIKKLSAEEGYPLWNKNELVSINDETRVYIPLVLKNTEYVSGYILYRQKGIYKSMHLVRGRTYDSYGFAPGAASHTIAGDLMRLNNLCFGERKFVLKDKRLFGLDKIPNTHPPFILEFTGQSTTTGIERAGSSNLMNDSSPRVETGTPIQNRESLIVPCVRLLLVSNCGVYLEAGSSTCGNVYVRVLSTPCTEPPLGPAGPGGSPGVPAKDAGAGGGIGGGLPGLNIAMPACPTGMSQQDCDARTVPVMSYLSLQSPFSNLESPVDSPEEPVIQNGIDVEDIPGFTPPGTPPKVIAHTRPRGNTEDLNFGSSADVSGIIPSMIPLPDDALFADMSRLFAACTIFDGELNDVGKIAIDKFRNRNGDPFVNPVLNKKVAQSSTLLNFAKQFGSELRTRLKAVNGDIDRITNFETDGYRPIFNGLYNKFHGLQILINDTEYTEVQLDKFSIESGGNWSAIVTITVHDHFGLDKNDALNFQNFHSGFASWWLLQHTRAYTPFETVITVQKKISGSLQP